MWNPIPETSVIPYVTTLQLKQQEQRKRPIAKKKAKSERIWEGGEGTGGNNIPGFSGRKVKVLMIFK